MSEDIEPYYRHNESHGLEVALTLRDEAAFSLAIKDAVPEMRFMIAEPWDTPEPVYIERIEARGENDEVDLTPWEEGARWRTFQEDRPTYPHQGKWFMPTDYRISFMYMRCKLVYAFKPDCDDDPLEMLVMGRFLSSQVRGDERATQIRRKVWRTVKKLMSNRLASAPLTNGAEPLPAIPAFDHWAGHDAMAWAREDPLRFIEYQGWVDYTLPAAWRKRRRLRPAREYTPPTGKWHRDLHARLEERYGPGLRDLPRFHRGPPNPNKFLPVI